MNVPELTSTSAKSMDSLGISKLQALFRGKTTRKGEYKRAKEGATVLCPFLASPPSVLDAVLKLTDKKLNSDSSFYDLGCGDGQILIGVAKMTNARCVGIDISEILCATARRRAREAGVEDRVNVRVGDLAELSLDDEEPTALFAFLVPSCLMVLSKSIFRRLKTGTFLILYKFPLPTEDGWTPITEMIVDDAVKAGAQASVFLYIV
jgi:SAM-dependent methyltransferase